MAKRTSLNPFKESEAKGEMHSMPELPEEIIDYKEPEKLCGTPEEFRTAVGRAQLDGLDYVEVTEELFNYLVKNQKTNYLTYGSPGIKVFKKGTREQLLREDLMKSEEWSTMMGERARRGQ